MLETYRVLTVTRTGIAKGSVICVTPGFYSTDAEALVAALHAEHAMFACAALLTPGHAKPLSDA